MDCTDPNPEPRREHTSEPENSCDYNGYAPFVPCSPTVEAEQRRTYWLRTPPQVARWP